MVDLNSKNVNIEEFAEKAIESEEFLSSLLDGMVTKTETIRENCSKILRYLSEKNPKAIYSQFDNFVKMLDSKNSYHQCNAIEILANLAASDGEDKFEKIFENYFDVLKSRKTIGPAYVAKNFWKIAKAKPELRSRISKKMLKIEELHHGKQIELIKSYIIDSFSQYFEDTENKEEVINFIRSQLDSESPKTRKAVQDFLNKWDN